MEKKSMEKKSMRCVKIVHDPAEVRMYRTLSAFFRFVGIFACENLIDDEYGDEVDWVCRIEKGSEEAGISLSESVTAVLIEMQEQVGVEIIAILSRIWKLFDQNDLVRSSYAIDYFGDCGKTYIYQRMEKALEAFEEVLERLGELEQSQNEDFQGNVYIWAAKSNCRRRINEIYTIIWKAIINGLYGNESEKSGLLKKLFGHHYFEISEIEKDISKILKMDSQFYAAYAILGFAKEIEDDYMVDSVEDFRQAIAIIGEKSYTSYLQYRIGRYYEKVLSDIKPQKMEYYKKAVDVDWHNFRGIYKIAVYEQDEGNLDKALELWKRLLDILQVKQHLPSLQPIECAYLYKAYRRLGFLYNKAKNYITGIEYLKKAEKVYNNSANEDEEKGFYPWMFGSEFVLSDGVKKRSWEVYKEAAKEKLKIERTYVEIVDASSRGNLREIHSEYVSYLA